VLVVHQRLGGGVGGGGGYLLKLKNDVMGFVQLQSLIQQISGFDYILLIVFRYRYPAVSKLFSFVAISSFLIT
jgi:hypothetical protein